MLVFVLLILGPLRAVEDEAARVIVLANARLPESVALATAYAGLRGVPTANILALPMPEAESITWREFVDQVHQPLQEALVRRGWIDVLASDLFDDFGRRRLTVTGHRIAYLVTCRGVPLRIHHDPTVAEPRARLPAPQFDTNQASVDAELSLLAQGSPAARAFVGNSLFLKERPTRFEAEQVVRVARLDGPTWEAAGRLATAAVAAEKHGPIGRYYVDLRGPHDDGDQWLESTRRQLDELGYEGEVEGTGATFAAEARFDAPVFYFGWYASHLNGPFLREGFRFPPGAVAVHIHSFSAASVREPGEGWCGPLVARGVTATVGNVFEPYLQLTHRPNLLLRALAQGRTWGEAVYYALPALGWQAVAIGDPLYRPFPAGEAGAASAVPPALAPYAVIREANLHARRNETAEALAMLRRAVDRAPSLPLILSAGRAERAAGDPGRASRTFQLARAVRDYRADTWPLGREIARELAALGVEDAALDIYTALADAPAPSPGGRLELLRDARALADRAGDLNRSLAFTRRLNEATTGLD